MAETPPPTACAACQRTCSAAPGSPCEPIAGYREPQPALARGLPQIKGLREEAAPHIEQYQPYADSDDPVIRAVVRQVAFALPHCERPSELSHVMGKRGRHILATCPSLPVL